MGSTVYLTLVTSPFQTYRCIKDHPLDKEPHSSPPSHPQIGSSRPPILHSCLVIIHAENIQSCRKKVSSLCNNFSFSPLPAAESLLCYFVACMGQEGLACSSIRTYLSGIRQLQIAAGFHDPHIDQMPRLNQVLKEVKVQATRVGRQPNSRFLIIPSIPYKLMLWAAAQIRPSSLSITGRPGGGQCPISHLHPTKTVEGHHIHEGS